MSMSFNLNPQSSFPLPRTSAQPPLKSGETNPTLGPQINMGVSADGFYKSEGTGTAGSSLPNNSARASADLKTGQALPEKKANEQRKAKEAEQFAQEQKLKEEEAKNREQQTIRVDKQFDRFRDLDKKNSLYRDGEKITITITQGLKKIMQKIQEKAGSWVSMKPAEQEKMSLPPGRRLRMQG